MADTSRPLDSTQNIDVFRFLLGIASTFQQRGRLDVSEVGRFQAVLHQLQAGTKSPFPSALSLFEALEREESALWSLILQRYGRYTVHRNLFRFSINNQTALVRESMHRLGSTLISKAELLFNRPFRVIQGSRHERTTLFSTGLIDVAKSIDLGSRIIDVASTGLNQMIPTDQIGMTAQDIEEDEAIAISLGFAGLEYEATLYGIEHTAVEALHGGLSGLSASISAFSDQLRHNSEGVDSHLLDHIIEGLSFSIKSLALFDIKPHASLDTWEMRRLRVSQTISSISDYLDELSDFLNQLLSKIASQPTPKVFPFTAGNVARRLTGLMMERGINSISAGKASHHLIDYCVRQQLNPNQIIDGELKNIDNNLSSEDLEFLRQTSSDGAFSSIAAEEKRINLKKMGHLRKVFVASTPTLIAIIGVGFLFVGGCGLKGTPKSALTEPRPEIPYKPMSIDLEKTTKDSDKNKETKRKPSNVR